MKRIVNLVWLIVLSLSIWAGNAVTGKVIDAGTKQPIDFANVSVEKAPSDNVQSTKDIVTGTITDEKGDFSIELEDGT